MGEKNRLETTLREEETRVRKEEADLKLAEQAFDNFLQENDRKAMEAQKKAEQEAKITSEKDEHIKSVEAEILQLKADIYNLKDVFRKFSMYGKFLATISPEEWRREQEAAAKRNRTRVPPSIQAIFQFLKKELSKLFIFIQAVLRLEEGESLEGDNYLYFKEPQELLDLFAKLEAENLSLIQQCQQAEARLEAGRAVSVKTRAELNQQAMTISESVLYLNETSNARLKIWRQRSGNWRRGSLRRSGRRPRWSRSSS